MNFFEKLTLAIINIKKIPQDCVKRGTMNKKITEILKKVSTLE